jgi:hypothetical protein
MQEQQELGYKGNYGLELILDMKGCDLSDLTQEKLGRFLIELVDRVKMKRHGDPIFWEDHSGIPHLEGVSAVQFIETSTIVCHPLPMLKAFYLNLFSCKPFDADDAIKFCMEYWGATSENHTVVTRV